jgi:hypothetical protein
MPWQSEASRVGDAGGAGVDLYTPAGCGPVGGVNVPVVQVSSPYNGSPQQAVMVLELSTATHDLPEHESMAKLEPEGARDAMSLPPAVPLVPVSGGVVMCGRESTPVEWAKTHC